VTGSETATVPPPRGSTISRATLAVGALIVTSTVIRFAAAQAFSTPWIAPDEMVYGMLGEGLWSHGTLTLRSFPSPYYSLLTPALIGAPLAALDLADGIQWARLLQALAMSLAALPTYLWARRLASQWWAVAAAALVLASPLLHYAGFLMTEPLTLTVVTAALLMLARALEEPSMWRYGVFVAWATAAAAVRLQALVLLPAFLLAAVIDSVGARDRRRLRPLLWFAALAAVACVLVVLLLLAAGEELSTRRLLGAYTPVGEASGVGGDRVDALAWHAFDVSVLGLGATVLAVAALAWVVLARRDRDPALRAFVSTTLAYTALLVVQVGLFAAVFVGSIAERYLLTLLPLLAIGLCTWAARGAPRALPVVLPTWALVVAGAATVPIDQLAGPVTLPNAPTPAALVRLGSEGWARAALVAGALAAGALVLALPRRLAWVTALVVGVGLALLSLDAGLRIADASEHEQRVAIGSGPAGWLDDAGVDDATLLVTGDRLWTATARTIFWNRGIVEAIRLAPATTPFPPVTGSVGVAPDGTLTTASGADLARSVVVTPSTITLAGSQIAARPAGDSEAYGLVAWRPEQPVRVALRTEGLLPNGDFTGTARITVYACRQGTLDVTILGKSGNPIEARVDGFPVRRLDTPNGAARTFRIPSPPYADGTRPCVFELENPGYAGTTTIAFTPAG
jgi:4-amino-4-deoxy-L-arabinose transferase-like glycosyltransferase